MALHERRGIGRLPDIEYDSKQLTSDTVFTTPIESLVIHGKVYLDSNVFKTLGRARHSEAVKVCHRNSGTNMLLFTSDDFTSYHYSSVIDLILLSLKKYQDASRHCPFFNVLHGVQVNRENDLVELHMFEHYGVSLREIARDVRTKAACPENVMKKLVYLVANGLACIPGEKEFDKAVGLEDLFLCMQTGLVHWHCPLERDHGYIKVRVNHETPYSSPEKLLGTKGTFPFFRRAQNVWSLGIMLLEFSKGKDPFFEVGAIFEILDMIVNGSVTDSIPHYLSSELKDLIALCLAKKPEDRPAYDELLKHPFLTNFEPDMVDLVAYVTGVTGSLLHQSKSTILRSIGLHKALLEDSISHLPLPSSLKDYLRNNM